MAPVIGSDSEEEAIVGVSSKKHVRIKTLRESEEEEEEEDEEDEDEDEDDRVNSEFKKRHGTGGQPRGQTPSQIVEARRLLKEKKLHKKKRLDKKKMKKKKKLSNANLQGANGGYAWEDDIQRSWDLVKVDEEGNIAALVASIVEARKKRAAEKTVTPYQRGIIRTLVLVLDCSEAMMEKDLRPTRYAMTVQYAIDFIHEYFDQNPISQLGIVVMKNGLAQLISQVSGNPQEHIDALKQLRKEDSQGNASLQNALEMARGLLLHVPAHCTREVLIVFGSLSTTDPGDIHQTIASLVHENIRAKVIGLSAQVAVCKELCKQTNYGDGSYYEVILNDHHFKELLTGCVTPLPVSKVNKGFTLVKMGFPTRVFEETPSFCACHSRLVHGGYVCPNCNTKVCSLPTVCPSCDLMLILSTHLARSYHHLMPLKTFQEVPVPATPPAAPPAALAGGGVATGTTGTNTGNNTTGTNNGTDTGDASVSASASGVSFPTNHCFGCQRRFPVLRNNKTGELLTSSRYRCEECTRDFCIDCDVFIHESLHNCPGCEARPM